MQTRRGQHTASHLDFAITGRRATLGNTGAQFHTVGSPFLCRQAGFHPVGTHFYHKFLTFHLFIVYLLC